MGNNLELTGIGDNFLKRTPIEQALRLTIKNGTEAGRWWLTPLIPALGRQKQVNPYEFEASLVYRS